MADLLFDPKTTALILIDLQKSIVARDTAPYVARDVVKNGAALAEKMRARGSLIVYVNVDLMNFMRLPVDKPRPMPSQPTPADSEIVHEVGMKEGDCLITKRQWGAFFGTDLEQRLRARNIKTVVLGGIATNYGVESTGRAAAGLGFELITIEDACTSLNADLHKFAFENIFPLLGRVRSTAEIVAALS